MNSSFSVLFHHRIYIPAFPLFQNFKNRSAFEEHELNHPPPTEGGGSEGDKMSGKAPVAAGHVCQVCKKKVNIVSYQQTSSSLSVIQKKNYNEDIQFTLIHNVDI
jgi:hypothetical protein